MNWSTIGSLFTIAQCVWLSGCNEPTAPPIAANLHTIPLTDVWAFDMPGTRDVRELEPEVYGEQVKALPGQEQSRRLHESMTQRIRDSLPYLRADKGKKPSAGFAVNGKGADSLQGAFNVLANNQLPSDTFSVGDDISLVFFSHSSGAYVHIERINRREDIIEIEYRFVNHLTQEMTNHFALIPLGALPEGNYKVRFTQSEAGESKPISAERSGFVVCGPFSFSIVKGETHD